jgi:hypothetical protein
MGCLDTAQASLHHLAWCDIVAIRHTLCWRADFDTQLRAGVDRQVQERLERFLSWLLDARWFPETDLQEKKRRKSELKKLRRILSRMRAFSQGIPDVRLARGLAEWQAYEENLVALVTQHVRSAPHISIGGSSKGSREIAERLMCAALILRKLRPRGSAYEEIHRLLADPSLLPYPITVSEEAIQELRSGTIDRPLTASEWNYLREGRDIPMRRYSISVKAIQSSVARLEKQLGSAKHSAQRAILHTLYAEYLWSQKFQAGFSDAEAALLNALVPAEADRKGGNSRTASG